MINLWMTRQNRVKENEGSRTPPWYSLPCVVQRLFVSWQPSFMAIDGVVFAETRCRPCLHLAFTPALPCPPASCPWFSPCSWSCLCLSCQTCILCVPALSPVSVMRAAFVVVLVPACNPVACCTYFCRHVPALASASCLTPVGVLIPVCCPSRTLFPLPARRGIRLCASWGLHGDAMSPTRHTDAEEVVFARENRGASAPHATCTTGGEEEALGPGITMQYTDTR